MTTTVRGTLGFLVSEAEGPVPFTDPAYARRLSVAAKRLGLTLYVFTPAGITGSASIKGYAYHGGAWSAGVFPPPDLIYDWCFTRGAKSLEKRKKLGLLAEKHPFRYLTRGLPGKWTVYQALKQQPRAAAFLPETTLYRSPRQLRSQLARWGGDVFMKPLYGTHGKKTLQVSRKTGHYQLTGRDGGNRVFTQQFDSLQAMSRFLEGFCRGKPFLMQPFLKLSTREGKPFDIRVLMQKGADGAWSRTGMAARIGRTGTLTSNLHGGGTAASAPVFLKHELGPAAAKSVLSVIRELSALIPPLLEEHFGRLAELGLDFGVDDNAKVWILEVNSKPGRSALGFIGDMDGARKAVEQPVLYACYLLNQSKITAEN